MNLQILKNKLQKDKSELRQIAKDAGNREFSENESERIDELKTSILKTTDEIANREYIASIEGQQAKPIVDNEDKSFAQRCKDYNIIEAVAHKLGYAVKDQVGHNEIQQELAHRADTKVAPDRLEIPLSALAKREQTIGTATAGGHLSQAEEYLAGELVRPLRPRLLQKAGVRMLTSTSKKITIPTQSNRSTITWLSETGSAAVADLTFGNITFEPKKAMSLHQWTDFVEQFSDPAFQQIATESLIADHMQAQESVFLVGKYGTLSGTIPSRASDKLTTTPQDIDAMPEGIFARSTATARSGATNGLKIDTLAAWISLFKAYAERNLPGMPSVITTYGVKFANKSVQKFSSTNGEALWDDQGMLLGVPAYATNQPAMRNFKKGTGTSLHGVIIGNFADSYLVQFGESMQMLLNPYAEDAYKSGSVMLRLISRIDCGVRYGTSSFITLDDVVVS